MIGDSFRRFRVFFPAAKLLFFGLFLLPTLFCLDREVSAQPVRAARTHGTLLRPLLGSLKGRGVWPVEVSIRNLIGPGNSSRETPYYLFRRDNFFGRSDGQRYLYHETLRMPAGSSRLTSRVLLRDYGGGSSYGDLIGLELDGDYNYTASRYDIERWQSQGHFAPLGMKSMQFLFVSPDPTAESGGADGNAAPNRDSASEVVAPAVPPGSIQPPDNGNLVIRKEELSSFRVVPTVWFLQQILVQSQALDSDSQRFYYSSSDELIQPESKAVADVKTADHVNAFNMTQWMARIFASDLPDLWQGLIPVDFMFFEVDDLVAIGESSPEKIEVIRQWVAMGGRVIVAGMEDQSDYDTIENLVEGDSTGVVRDFWTDLNVRATVQSSRIALEQGEIGSLNLGADATFFRLPGDNRTRFIESSSRGQLQAINPITQRHEGLPKSENFVAVACYGSGRFVAMGKSTAEWGFPEWKLALISAQVGSFAPLMADFNPNVSSDMQFPGLGEPPMSLFLVFVTLFGIGAGPVAYFLLASTGRLPWIVVVVPLAALLLTGSLISYAMISEGLYHRSYQFSLTDIDSVNGLANNRTTHWCYSGTNPGEYVFPADEYLFPTDDASSMSTEWMDDRGSLHVSKGAIASRRSHLFSVAGQKTFSGKMAVEKDELSGQWIVTNLLGVAVPFFVARTDEGWLIHEDIGVDQSVTIEQVPFSDIRERMVAIGGTSGSILNDLRGIYVNPFRYFDRYELPERDYSVFPAGSIFTSPVEGAIRIASPETIEQVIGKNRYLAISGQSPLVRKITPSTRVLREFHVFHGRW